MNNIYKICCIFIWVTSFVYWTKFLYWNHSSELFLFSHESFSVFLTIRFNDFKNSRLYFYFSIQFQVTSCFISQFVVNIYQSPTLWSCSTCPFMGIILKVNIWQNYLFLVYSQWFQLLRACFDNFYQLLQIVEV